MKKIVSILSVIAMLLTVVSLFGATVSAAEAIPSFSEGTITETDSGNTIASDDFSVFVSSRASAWGGKSDLRFLLVADQDKLSAYVDSGLSLAIQFVDANGITVKTLTQDVFEDLVLYASATAAGNVYTAAEGDVLFGIVINEAPNTAWTNVTVTLNADKPVAQGSANSETVSTQEGEDLTFTDLGGNSRVFPIDCHYGKLALDFAIGGAYSDIIPSYVPNQGDWNNPKYQWVLRVNGEEIIPAKLSMWHFGDWGQLRAELGSVHDFEFVDGLAEFYIELKIVDVETGKIKYYINYVEKNGGAPLYYQLTPYNPDPNLPDDVTSLTHVELVSGPEGYGGNPVEGSSWIVDGMVDYKLCTIDKAPIIVKLPKTTAIKGMSIINQANLTNPERALLDFDVYVSADGENWGDTPVFTSTSEGKDRTSYSYDYAENYFGFAEAVEATYVKIVTHHTEGVAYQFAEVLFYQ